MAERRGPAVYSIAAHRGFADALVAGLIPRYAEVDYGLARLTLLLPSNRAVRTLTEAFVRASGAGLLLPRMVTIGDLDLDETLGALLDPLGEGEPVAPAADPNYRLFKLAEFLAIEQGGASAAALLRQARGVARALDRLAVEDVDAADLLALDIGELSGHWQDSLRTFARVQLRWRDELAARGEIDLPERRNRLLRKAAARWRAAPPAHPIVAAGVTSAAPAVAELLRVVSELPQGAVILPDLDLQLEPEVWADLGRAGAPGEDGQTFGRGDAITHPQYHLKLLLNRMGIARDEVMAWHRSGPAAAPPARSRAISNLFLPPDASVAWIGLAADQRRLSGVRIVESAHPDEEAQTIAILIREALEVPERRVALITPDRGLAARVIGHLARWNIAADDSAGTPLSQTPAGRMVLALAELAAEQASPVPLLAALTHPLAGGAGDRALWLDHARALDLALRGPRPEPGLDAITRRVTRLTRRHPQIGDWWQGIEAALAPLMRDSDSLPLGELLAALMAAGEGFCGVGLWAQADGRAAAALIEAWQRAAEASGAAIDPRELAIVLRDAMDEVAVRPPYGGHPRVAIYGLIEARMTRADLVICGALHEGSWPAPAAPDALLAPAVLRQLGVPGSDFRIGLSAHDLAGALGAPEVVLSYAERDAAGPVIPSRFLLRLRAMLGKEAERETRALALAQAIDARPPARGYVRPRPMPSPEQRRVPISVTALDRLRGDPYQFYAQAILRLRRIDALDAELTPAGRGEAAHRILQRWYDEAKAMPGTLAPIAEDELAKLSAHPFMRGIWRPRLMRALEWVEAHTAKLMAEGRAILACERDGEMITRGIRIHGRADRIDRHPDGRLVVIDYKTGTPPTNRKVQDGFALQLGVLGLIAQGGGFGDGVVGEPHGFEYWSLARNSRAGEGQFGFSCEPILEGSRKTGIPRGAFLSETRRFLDEALDRWILGNEPFVARLNPDLGDYNDYDQLMRLDEWQGRGGDNA